MNKLLKALKQFFIPHKNNDYKPHFFREFSILSITVISIILISISASTILYIKNTNMTATVLPAVLVDLTNSARNSNNEQSLNRSTILDNAARLKAEDMAKYGYFAHTSPQGITPWYWFNKAGYAFKYAGENLAINFTESDNVENAWLASPSHRANILNNHFTEIGIATAYGIYQGQPTTYVVQMFGSPAIQNTEKSKTEPIPTSKTNQDNQPVKSIQNPIVALAPSVKGESITKTDNLQIITNTKDFISVKNNATTDKLASKDLPVSANYSSWFDRFIFLAPSYVNKIYKIFIWIVILSLLAMTFIEIRKQHLKNIIYGILVILILFCFIYINKTMFLNSFIA
ncbi:MAG: hypothetical protein KGI58_03710 [Patescibacteria group bacterium]|nr:hypothetical protein [Patescibacteria group bacterium]